MCIISSWCFECIVERKREREKWKFLSQQLDRRLLPLFIDWSFLLKMCVCSVVQEQPWAVYSLKQSVDRKPVCLIYILTPFPLMYSDWFLFHFQLQVPNGLDVRACCYCSCCCEPLICCSKKKGGMSSRHTSLRTCCSSSVSVMCLSVMVKQLTLILLYLTCTCYSLVVPGGRPNDLAYNNQFAVNIPNATEVLVQLIAEKHGFRSLGQVNIFY